MYTFSHAPKCTLSNTHTHMRITICYAQGHLSTVPPQIRLDPLPHLHRSSSTQSTTSSQYISMPISSQEPSPESASHFASIQPLILEPTLGTSPESAFQTPSCCSQEEFGVCVNNTKEEAQLKERDEEEEENAHRREFDDFFQNLNLSRTNGDVIERGEEAVEDVAYIVAAVNTGEKEPPVKMDKFGQNGGISNRPEHRSASCLDKGGNEFDATSDRNYDGVTRDFLDSVSEISSRKPGTTNSDSGIDTISSEVPALETKREHELGAVKLLNDKVPFFDEETIDVLRMTSMAQIDDAISETKTMKEMIEGKLREQQQQRQEHELQGVKDFREVMKRKLILFDDNHRPDSNDATSLASYKSSLSSSSSSSICCQEEEEEWYSPKVVPPVTRRLFDKDLTPLRELAAGHFKVGLTALKELKAAIAGDDADEWTMEEEEEEEEEKKRKSREEKRRVDEERRRRLKESENAKRRSSTKMFEMGYGYEDGNGDETKSRPKNKNTQTIEESENSGNEEPEEEANINWGHF